MKVLILHLEKDINRIDIFLASFEKYYSSLYRDLKRPDKWQLITKAFVFLSQISTGLTYLNFSVLFFRLYFFEFFITVVEISP